MLRKIGLLVAVLIVSLDAGVAAKSISDSASAAPWDAGHA